MGNQSTKSNIWLREFFHDEQLYPRIKKWMEQEYLMFEYGVEELLVEYCVDDDGEHYCQGYFKTTKTLEDIRNLFTEHLFEDILLFESDKYEPTSCMIDCVMYKK